MEPKHETYRLISLSKFHTLSCRPVFAFEIIKNPLRPLQLQVDQKANVTARLLLSRFFPSQFVFRFFTTHFQITSYLIALLA